MIAILFATLLAGQLHLRDCATIQTVDNPAGLVLTSSVSGIVCARGPGPLWEGALVGRQAFTALWRDSAELPLVKYELALTSRLADVERHRSEVLVSWASAATDRAEAETARASILERRVRSLEDRVSPLAWVGIGVVVGSFIYLAVDRLVLDRL